MMGGELEELAAEPIDEVVMRYYLGIIDDEENGRRDGSAYIRELSNQMGVEVDLWLPFQRLIDFREN